MEYKTIVNKQYEGKDYVAADDLLNEAARTGWEVIGTNLIGSLYKGAAWEIFYLARKHTGPSAKS